ncbi:MAG: type II secretion system GspH family protein [Candidatus Riflebacteria bacterium]|nr:type II secretion system GspH family protein [Candidatus Riflebacteria bacterium]
MRQNNIFSRRSSAFTLLEIILAMAILAATMVPIFYFMSKGASDTDINVSRMYAVSRASEVLNAMLDNVPFQALRAGIPGFIRIDDLAAVDGYEKYDEAWAIKFVTTVFPGSEKTAAGWPCQNIVKDPRGQYYKITLRVEDMPSLPATTNLKPEMKQIGTDYPGKAPSDFGAFPAPEPTFSFLKNPAKLLSQAWHQRKYVPNPVSQMSDGTTFLFETELPGKVSENHENFYRDDGYEKYQASAFRFSNPTATRMTQRMAKSMVSYTNDENFKYCGLKRLIIEVQWNIEKAYLQDPDQTGVGLRRIHLITIKADIDV